MDWIVDTAKEVFGADPKAKTRRRRNVWARRAVYALNYNGQTLSSLGNAFGQDHASVIHQQNMHKDLMQFDKEYTELYNEFQKLVCGNVSKHYSMLRVTIPKDDALKQRILNFIESEVEQYENAS